MARPKATHVKPVRHRLPDGSIRIYYYDRRTGQRVGYGPEGDAAAREAAEARAAGYAEPSKPHEGSLAALIADYRGSAAFARCKPRTREFYAHLLDMLRDRAGDVPAAGITTMMVEKMREALSETPAKANHAVAVLSIVYNHGIRRGLVSSNPASHAGRFKTAPRTAIWSIEQEQRMMAALRPSLKLGFGLLLYTLQRVSDVLAMTKDQIQEHDGRLFITLRQQKTDELVAVPVHQRLEPLLRARLADKSGVLLVPSPTGRTWSRRNFSRAWDTDCVRADAATAVELERAGWSEKQIKDELAARHRQRRDLRRTGMVRMAEAGATTPQIAAVSGHSIDYCQRILDTYIPRRTEVAIAGIDVWERAGLSTNVIRLLERNVTAPSSGKCSGKSGKSVAKKA